MADLNAAGLSETEALTRATKAPKVTTSIVDVAIG
jgi:hypothetical protein